MNDKDEEIIRKYIEGESLALRFLIDRYIAHIYNYSTRFVGRDSANDVTQEVFIKVWKNIKKFDAIKSSFKTWLFTIARNTVTDYLRKRKMTVFSDLDNEEESFTETIKDEVILPSEAMEKLEDKEFLNSLLHRLPDKYKEVLILYYQEEMTFREIGKALDKPLNTVKSWHYRALKLLKEMI